MQATDVETDLSQIKALLNEGFRVKKSYHALEKYESKARMKASHYMVYSFEALPVLIERMKTLDQFGSLHRKARYVVNELGEIWFALEGVPGDNVEYLSGVEVDPDLRKRERIPAHSDMVPKRKAVIASGIVVFSARDYFIEALSNWSGHIRPHPNSLVWPLAILHHLGANFSPEFKLLFFSKVGHVEKQEPVSVLASRIHELLSEIAFVPPPSRYEIRVRSEDEWESFGPEKTPHFKIAPAKDARKRSLQQLFDQDPSDVFDDEISEDVSVGKALLSGVVGLGLFGMFPPLQEGAIRYGTPPPAAIAEEDYHMPTQGLG